jgi:acyl carrier protein
MKADLEAKESQSEDEVLNQLCSHLAIDKRNPNETLGDIGLDSMMAVEIQQRLERDYEISLTLNDVRKITVGELKDFRDGKRDGLKQYAGDIKKARLNISKIKWDYPTDATTHLNDITVGKPIFILPPIEGVFSGLLNLAKAINRPVIAINWMKNMKEMKEVKKVSKYFVEKLKQVSPEGQFDLIGHSFGAIISLNMLRKGVPIRKLVVLDTSHKGVNETPEKDEKFDIFFSYLGSFFPMRVLEQLRGDVMCIKEDSGRINKLIEFITQYGGKHLQGKDADSILRGSFDRADMIIHYKRKNMVKLQALQEHAPKIIKKRLNKIGSNVTVLKLMRDEEEFKNIREIMMVEYGVKSEDCATPFDFHPVYGREGEFLNEENGNLEAVAAIVNEKLCK